MKEDEEIPLILDRTFMNIARIIIDVDKGKLKVRTQDDEITFNLFYDLKNSDVGKDCLQKIHQRKPLLTLKSNWISQI